MKRRETCFKAVIAILTASACAFAIFLYRQRTSFRLTQSIKVLEGENLFTPDAQLGYRDRPGQYHLRLRRPGVRGALDFRVRIDPDQSRATSLASANPSASSKPEVWFLGCSYFWGWGVDDERTLPWLVQSKLSQARVRNFSGNGYGQAHQWRLLTQGIENGRRPNVAVFGLNVFYLERNVVQARWKSAFTVWDSLKGAGLLRARLRGAADRGPVQLALDIEPLNGLPPSGPAPTAQEELDVARRLLDEILATCRKHDILPIGLVYIGALEHPMIEHARAIGFHVVDARPPAGASEAFTLEPLDVHPNATWHRHAADQVTPLIERLLTTQVVDKKGR